jgi:hypothetical protein
MSQQPENEALTPQQLREALLLELETSQQALADLSDEQLEDVAGGLFSFTKVVNHPAVTRISDHWNAYGDQYLTLAHTLHGISQARAARRTPAVPAE